MSIIRYSLIVVQRASEYITKAAPKCSPLALGLRKEIHMTSSFKLVAGLVLSAGILTAVAATPTTGAWGDELITNGPQRDAGDTSGAWSAERNVRDSQRYEALVQANPNFRANRMRRECGPIGDPQMHADCLASFGGGSGSFLPSSRD
jgi:hypothetical protein